MLGHSAISESSISDTGSLVVVYTNLYDFVVYIKTDKELELIIKKIELLDLQIRKIEYVV